MQKVKVTAAFFTAGAGLRLGLTEPQLKARRHNIEIGADGICTALRNLQFKHGEELSVDRLDKADAAYVKILDVAPPAKPPKKLG